MPFCGMCGAPLQGGDACRSCGALADTAPPPQWPQGSPSATPVPPPSQQPVPASPWEEVTFSRPSEVAMAPASAHLGRYVKIERIGGGSFGEVWEAWDKVFERWVALKLLKNVEAEEVRAFVREAKTAVRLRHSRIAEVYDAADVDGQYFIAMQRVRGETLERRIGGDVDASVRLIRDAAEGVHFAHEQGFVHRDLKPANLMVEPRPGQEWVYVLDFGIAKWLAGPGTRRGGGTLLYMAPEQMEAGAIDGRADVHALGATIYHMVTGRPYLEVERGHDVFAVMRAIREAKLEPPSRHNPGIDAELDDIVMRCLARDPVRRLPRADQLAAELGEWLELRRIRRESMRPRQSWPTTPPLQPRPMPPPPPLPPPSPPPSPPQQRFASSSSSGRYALLVKIGEGGFSEVWRARDHNLDIDIALKLLHREIGSDKSVVRMFHRGVEIQGKVRHPVLVPITDAGYLSGDDRWFIAMPFIDGRSLEESRLPVREKLRLLRDVAWAAHAVHERGYHRFDVKPGNILVQEFPDQPTRAAWMDLETALFAEDEFREGMLVGTPAVMAPEQADGQRGDRRVDIYAIGSTLYQLIAGRYPVEFTSIGEMLGRVIRGQITPLGAVAPQTDARLVAIVMRCLALTPQDRFPDAAALARSLTEYLMAA